MGHNLENSCSGLGVRGGFTHPLLKFLYMEDSALCISVLFFHMIFESWEPLLFLCICIVGDVAEQN